MRDINITLVGWVASDPTFVITRDGQGPPLSTFRMGQTPRYRDRTSGEWKDGQTEWFTVRIFNDAATTVARSIKKGQPVIVEGRMRTSEWVDKEDKPRTTLQVDANVVGHDLTLGIASFNRATVTSGEDEFRAPDDQAPDPLDAAEQFPDDDALAPLEEEEAALS